MSTTDEQREAEDAIVELMDEHLWTTGTDVEGKAKCARAILARELVSEPAAPVDARDALTVLRELWEQVIFYQYSFPKGFMPRELGVRVNAVLDASPIARQAAAPASSNLGEPS